MTLTLGIDPGQKGGLALLDSTGFPLLVADLPLITDRSLTWVDGSALQSTLMEALQGRQCHAYVERVGSMPGQGVASSFAFGVGFGSILSVLQTLQLPLTLITPAAWKKNFGLSRDKHASLHLARLRFPSADLALKKHEGRAEALLIAAFGRQRQTLAVAT